MPTTASNAGFDAAKIETLRRHLLLTVKDMAVIFGVSRMTYYTWVQRGTISPARSIMVKARLKELLAVVTAHKWPSKDVLAMTQKQRTQRLLELLDQEQ